MAALSSTHVLNQVARVDNPTGLKLLLVNVRKIKNKTLQNHALVLNEHSALAMG